MTTLTPERIAELRALYVNAGYSYDTRRDWNVALASSVPALLDAAERAAKWRAVAEELAGLFMTIDALRPRVYASLDRFDALAKEERDESL